MDAFGSAQTYKPMYATQGSYTQPMDSFFGSYQQQGQGPQPFGSGMPWSQQGWNGFLNSNQGAQAPNMAAPGDFSVQPGFNMPTPRGFSVGGGNDGLPTFNMGQAFGNIPGFNTQSMERPFFNPLGSSNGMTPDKVGFSTIYGDYQSAFQNLDAWNKQYPNASQPWPGRGDLMSSVTNYDTMKGMLNTGYNQAYNAYAQAGAFGAPGGK